jgi:hypothetical protein
MKNKWVRNGRNNYLLSNDLKETCRWDSYSSVVTQNEMQNEERKFFSSAVN